MVITANAQIGVGGIPEGMLLKEEQQYISVTNATAPDWESFIKKEETLQAPDLAQPFTIALFTPLNISFPSSGTFKQLENGKIIWCSQLKIENAPAIGLYYDRFHLPKGVKYYITNGNGNQILGAFTAANNTASGFFATEAIQGSVVNLEIDIEFGVNLEDINFHIDRSAVYFRGYEYLHRYSNPVDFLASEADSALDGSSSGCMINAICPLGANNAIQRKASVQLLIPQTVGGETALGVCSGTMVNSVENTPTNCKPYLLTASHCNSSNDTTSDKFDQTIIRFNFERALCTGGIIPEAKTMTGINFISRSIHTSPLASNTKGDFLLLELRQVIPTSWDVTLAGWNNSATIPLTATAPEKFTGFHHPSGDTKKVSSSHVLESKSLGMQNSHWGTQLDSGYVAGGSSGSGLFDGKGRQIGVLTGGNPSNLVPVVCEVNGKGDPIDVNDIVFYSKFSFIWDYSVDGNNPRRKLKPWLDPGNTGTIMIDALHSNCTSIGGTMIPSVEDDLANSISISPNPTSNGKVIARFNLKQAMDLTVELYDITGKKQQSAKLNKVKSGSHSFDLSDYANGMYIIRFFDGATSTSKKILLAR
ncbi:hypothetical protein BFS30_24785 [Pedobacter steynii]|uniref:Secretion system C-terminal sorting domain-containing protein n=2 Tax=Pedobacter steynii TaxID=430522 RepID=A0A1D7QN64_9SPHI|nr:hypothetical protein BFS30_24785 [Pedobacter steynii]